MNRSDNSPDHLLPEHSALQHERAPRPLPLFLEMVRMVGENDPQTARAALDGLVKYERAARTIRRPTGRVVARVGPAVLRDHGGAGPPAILVPSLINPPDVLDLDEDVSLASAIAQMGRRSLLLDWGPARERADHDIGGHVANLLAPLIEQLDEQPALIGYCLGGTMAIAAANLTAAECVATIAAPWRFSNYPEDSRKSLLDLWRAAKLPATSLKVLPMEVLQAAFWSLDPSRTVAKFADFAKLDAGEANERRFVVLEDWANEGEALPFPAARELIEDFFGSDLPGSGRWKIRGRAMSDRLAVPLLNCTASKDRITPAVSAPAGTAQDIPSGHVGMIVGSARHGLHRALAAFLDPACR
ncbi:alpha/beta hydrolase [Sphingomonas daechungensis]|uniref:alpha/beta hydrolase n=1 Tax=Sphingomonas daechungensis TaxID=1176646 RepID=UPI0037834627